MTLTKLAIDNPVAFLALCDKLRARGVVKLGALVLGPLPRETSHATRDIDPDAEARRKHDVMFAAVRRKPPFVPPVADESGLPRAIVLRRARDEAAANGEAVAQR